MFSSPFVLKTSARKQDLRRGGITPPDGSQVTVTDAILVLSLPLMKREYKLENDKTAMI